MTRSPSNQDVLFRNCFNLLLPPVPNEFGKSVPEKPLSRGSEQALDEAIAAMNFLPPTQPQSDDLNTSFSVRFSVDGEHDSVSFVDAGGKIVHGTVARCRILNVALDASAKRFGIKKLPWHVVFDVAALSAIRSLGDAQVDLEFADMGIEPCESEAERGLAAFSQFCAVIYSVVSRPDELHADAVRGLLYDGLSRYVSQGNYLLDSYSAFAHHLHSQPANAMPIRCLSDLIYHSMLNVPASTRGAYALASCPLCGRLFSPNRKANQLACPFPGNPTYPELSCLDARKKIAARLSSLNSNRRKQLTGHLHWSSNQRGKDRAALEALIGDYNANKVTSEVKGVKGDLRRLFFYCCLYLNEDFATSAKRQKNIGAFESICTNAGLGTVYRAAMYRYLHYLDWFKAPESTLFWFIPELANGEFPSIGEPNGNVSDRGL